MQRAQGFGGFFFRAKNPEGLAKWYHDHLGINPAPKNMEMPPRVTEAGVTVFGPFAADTDYFAADKTFMLNFRVTDLDAMIAQLKSADIEVSHESEMEGIGRFARIHDPEGNAIEIGEPVGEMTPAAPRASLCFLAEALNQVDAPIWRLEAADNEVGRAFASALVLPRESLWPLSTRSQVVEADESEFPYA